LIEGTPSTGEIIVAADKIEVEVTGKSKYEVAHQIAFNILTVIEKKKLEQVSRTDYLNAVADAIRALGGGYK
jgi:hypothetical protein